MVIIRARPFGECDQFRPTPNVNGKVKFSMFIHYFEAYSGGFQKTGWLSLNFFNFLKKNCYFHFIETQIHVFKGLQAGFEHLLEKTLSDAYPYIYTNSNGMKVFIGLQNHIFNT